MEIKVIDSHTAGEPTRVILDGQLDLRGVSPQERMDDFIARFDGLRKGMVLEPRGSDVVVGAILCPPTHVGSVATVLFFNNSGPLGMCGHGTIGVAETLSHLGRIDTETHQIDTVVGPVTFSRNASGEVSVKNVESYRFAKNIQAGNVVGDIAFGGNWFFVVHHNDPEILPTNIPELTRLSVAIRRDLERSGITGEKGAQIDHIELSSTSRTPGVDATNFVLCPGLAFDRSPCGTGTSAKMACLAEDGLLSPGQLWTQESVTGGIFRGSVEKGPRGWLPTIRGRAFVSAEATLIFQEDDPYREGLMIQ